MRLFDGLFKSFKSVRTFAMTTRELVKLVIIFLGGAPPGGIRFLAPEAMHQARWMSKVLYSFKIWMFRGQFRLTKKEERGLQRLCLFVVRVYAKAWIEASFSVQAPRLDLELIKALAPTTRSTLRSETSRCRNCQAICGTCQKNWLGCPSSTPTCPARPKTPWLRPYDERNLTERTRLRKESRFQRSRSEISTWKTSSVDVLSTSSGSYTWMRPFLDLPPDSWQMDEGFQRSSQIVRNLAVVNDHAERGVALIQEFNGSLTKDEEQLQFLLQVVADHRKAFPDPRKRTLAHTRPQ
ncbi:hypothetical protein GWK47_041316 [Chionoecetes opilio]|uniref:Uncharacterized protein n=1 Tax=Chionoecetes opilio TaxID=41210 RepID=A0A8J4YA14_CHIOP|nr:hypothetical protein GWK47_041316 [Chionoecetes opilio]